MELNTSPIVPAAPQDLTPLKPDEFESKHVIIDEEGKIKQITISNKDLQLDRLIDENLETARKLFEVALSLKGGKVDKVYQETATKVIGLYHLNQESPEKHAVECESLAQSLTQQTGYLMHKKTEMDAIEQAKHLKSEGNLATPEIFERLLDHIETTRYESFGQDVFRHVMEGAVELKEGDFDLFYENEVRMFDLSGEDYPEEEIITSIANRLEVMLRVFQDKILPPSQEKSKRRVEDVVEQRKFRDEVRELIDEIRKESKSDNVPQLIEEKIKNWRHGTQYEKKLASLVAPLNQIYYVTKVQNLMSLMKTDEKLHDLKFAVENKKFVITFDPVKRVLADVSVDLKLKNSSIKINQKLSLSASLMQLDRWNCAISYEIQTTQAELSKAKKLQILIEAQGDKCHLTLLS